MKMVLQVPARKLVSSGFFRILFFKFCLFKATPMVVLPDSTSSKALMVKIVVWIMWQMKMDSSEFFDFALHSEII